MTRKSGFINIIKSVAFVMALSIVIASMGGCNTCSGNIDPTDYSKITNPVSTNPSENPTESTAIQLADNPINFAELKKLNSDLRAWIKIPGTVIDYPVAQSSNEDDDYYLHHNYLGNYEFAGTIYLQRHNFPTFTDRVTVLYGHNMLNGSMFAGLHDFEDKDFFDKNEFIYIYIKNHILTYRIFAAFDYDNRHILNSFNFKDDSVFEQYLYDCQHPHSTNAVVRDGVDLGLDDRLLVLSTCTNYNSSLRFLVMGVLVDDQLTK